MIFTALGLMSGTSCDGVDAALIETDGESYIRPLDSLFSPYNKDFRKKLIALMNNAKEGNFDLNFLEIENELTSLHAKAVQALAAQTKRKIDMIGFHGQTIFHSPERGITWQLGNIPMLSHITGFDVIGDFRRRDVAAGGQGAPLLPLYLKALYESLSKGSRNTPIMFLNIGGVANPCYINQNVIMAFDCGSGNAIIDDLHEHFYGTPCDTGGSKARVGKVDETVLTHLLSNKFFDKIPPKSLDRNTFDVLPLYELTPNDALATATEFTAMAFEKSLKFTNPHPDKVIVYGGGRKNTYLMERIKHYSPQIDLMTLEEAYKIDGDMLEAQAFGYLAVRCFKKLPISLPQITGCSSPITGGVICQATITLSSG